jgi:hypothetical protein
VRKAEGNILYAYRSCIEGPPGSWIMACSKGSARNLGDLVVSVVETSFGSYCDRVQDAAGAVSP